MNTPSEVNGIRFYAFLIVIGSLQELTVYSPKHDTTWTYSRSISGSPATWSIWSKTVMADENGKTSVKDLEVTGAISQPYISTSFAIGYGLSVTAKRVGNFVTITFKGSNTITLGSGARPNERIPLGYRPAETEPVDCLVQGRHLDTYYYFNPDSTIAYMGQDVPVNSYFRGVRGYFTNDPWPVIE